MDEEFENTQWYYVKDGKRFGPIPLSILRAKVRDRELFPSDEVWTQGLDSWEQLKDFDIGFEWDVPPPINTKSIGNGWVWLAAFAPFIGATLELGAAYALNDNPFEARSKFYDSEYWLISLTLNVFSCGGDAIYLRNSGYKRFKFLKWFVIFVPLYLFMRAATLKTTYAYAWTWVAMVIATILVFFQ